jgi:hypothetical protein
VEELRRCLWTWTAPHPDWTPKDGGPDGWERDACSYAYDARESLALLDLPVELVLPTHGDPVTEGAREALERALAAS